MTSIPNAIAAQSWTDAAPQPSKDAAAVRRALAGLSLATLLAALGTSIANVALPAFAEAFAAPFQQVQWIVLAYLLAITTVVVSAGRLGDLAGRRRLLLTGIAFFTVASIVCGSAPALWLLIAGRAAQGIGAAVMTALAMAMLGEAVPAEKTGSAMGLLGTMSAAGTALGPSLGGLLLAGPGWRSIFLVNVPLGAAAFLLAWRSLPADRERTSAPRARFDHAGTLLLALTLAAYALAMTTGGGTFGAMNIALLVAAAFGIILFAAIERRAAAPLVDLRMFRDRVLSGGFAMSMLVTTVVMATLVVGPFYLSGALALDAAAVGLVMTCGPLVAAVTGFPAGRVVDRIGARRTQIAGLAGMAAGSMTLAFAAPAFSITGYVVPLAILTAGYAMFQTANNTAVMSGVAASQRGVVSGMLNLSRNIGLITGASVMGAIFAAASRSSGITSSHANAVAAGMRMTFAAGALLVIVAIVIALLRAEPRE